MLKTLDPRTKLILVSALSTTAVLVDSIQTLLPIFLISMVVSLVFKISILKMAGIIKRLFWMTLTLIIIQSIFSAGGLVLISIRGLTILTIGGIKKGLVFTMKIMIIAVSGLILNSNSSRELIQGLVQWRVPYEIAFMVSIAIRFLPMLAEEIRDVMVAIQLKGISLERIPVRKRISLYSYVLMPVVMGTLLKAKKLSMAMEMRAFGAYDYRTSYHILQMRIIDYTVIAIVLLAFLGFWSIYYFVS